MTTTATTTTAVAPALKPGAVVANLHSLTGGPRTVLTAGELFVNQAFPTRQAAFAHAYQSSLGADQGALLIGRSGGTFTLQAALQQAADGTLAPYDLERLAVGDRPVAGRGGMVPALVAVIDGASILVPAN